MQKAKDSQIVSGLKPWQVWLHTIIFEADTPGGKAFDVGLLIAILLSVGIVMLESVSEIYARYGWLLSALEWFITGLFTLEYVLRIISVEKPIRYIISFFGIIDLLALIPGFLSFFIAGAHTLVVIRMLRLLRVFRIFKMSQFVGEGNALMDALKASRYKIIVFLVATMTIVVIAGTLMFLVEGAENGFTSIPRSIYWAIVTLTTVGYGDIAPHTVLGQALASLIMIMGYGIIAVPTGIVGAELSRHKPIALNTRACPECSAEGHDENATFCKYCGARL